MKDKEEAARKMQNRFNEVMAWTPYLRILPDGYFLQRVWNMAVYDDKPMHTQILIKDQMAEDKIRLYEKMNQ